MPFSNAGGSLCTDADPLGVRMLYVDTHILDTDVGRSPSHITADGTSGGSLY